MRSNLNSAVNYLRELRTVVPDELIESIVIADNVQIALKFPSEEFIARFGQNYLSHARVERIEQNDTIVWRAIHTWHKRQFIVLMKVDQTLGLPAREAFSTENVRPL